MKRVKLGLAVGSAMLAMAGTASAEGELNIFNWGNYTAVLSSNRFVTYFFNTLVVTGSATLFALVVGVPAGYGLARMRARKAAVVYRFGHSSFYMGVSTPEGGPAFHERYMLDPREYAAYGGSFPIIVDGTGPVGTMTVSGLPQQADHELVVELIGLFLGQRFGRTSGPG